jgi:hypothetical protein
LPAPSAGVELREQGINQMLVICLTQLRIADQAADALAFLTQPLQERGIFRSIIGLKLPTDSLRQGRAVPCGRDGDLQSPTTDDGGGDKITGVRRIDDIDPDVMPTGSFAHRQIHGALIGGPHDQRAAQYIVRVKRAGLMLNDPLRDQRREGFGQPRADHDDRGAGFQQSLHLPCGNFAAADDQAPLALQIQEYWIIACHVFVLPPSLMRAPEARGAEVRQIRSGSKNR